MRRCRLAGKTLHMLRFFVLLATISFSSGQAQSQAQEAVREPVEIGESGEAYQSAIRLRGIDTDAAYFDPDAPPPELDTTQQPDSPPEEGDGASGTSVDAPDWTAALIAAGILAMIAYFVMRFGGGLAVSLKRDAENTGTGRGKHDAQAPAWAEKLSSFDEILRIKDRQQALILLTRKVLAATVAANGILMQRSWTARDALRHIPGSQNQLQTLRDLVMTAERVQFGDRTVSEDEFRDHAERCRLIMGPEAA